MYNEFDPKHYKGKWPCTTKTLCNEKTLIGRLHQYFLIYFETFCHCSGVSWTVTFHVYRFDFIIGGMKDGMLEMANGHFFHGIRKINSRCKIIYGNRQNLIVSHYRIKIFSWWHWAWTLPDTSGSSPTAYCFS